MIGQGKFAVGITARGTTPMIGVLNVFPSRSEQIDGRLRESFRLEVKRVRLGWRWPVMHLLGARVVVFPHVTLLGGG